ncbi:MAG: 50S ribosomal protein L9 [Planctomycetota bacterium]
MAKTITLLLTENVDNLGIVGDVVNVKLGYARNYLLPRDMATTPSDDLIEQLAEKRKQAESDLAELRKQREALIQKIDGLELTMKRPCNDQGILYGSVTQHDIAMALQELGYQVKDREVRLGQTMKRVDAYEVSVKLASDLEGTIKIHIVADREIEDDSEEMEFDNEGNLIEKPQRRDRSEPASEEQTVEETPAAE